MKDLSKILGQVRDIQARIASALQQREGQIVDVLGRLKAEVARGQIPGNQLRQQVFGMEVPIKEARAEYLEGLRDLAKQAENLLTPNQRKQIEDYRPCTIPPRSLTNPTAIGSVATPDHLIHMFDRIRQAPPRVYDNHKPRVVDNMLHRLRLHFAGHFDATEGRKLIEDFFDKIRSISDADWEIQKNDLVTEHREALEERFGPKRPTGGAAVSNKIRSILLNPSLLPILAGRIAAGGAPAPRAPTEDDLPPAPRRPRRFGPMR